MTTKHLPWEWNGLAHMISHVGDRLTAMGKHGDGSMTPQQASSLLSSNLKDKGYLAHMHNFIEEVGSGVINTRVQVMNISLHSDHGHSHQICDDKYTNPPGFEVRHLNLDPEEVTAIIDAYARDANPFHKVDISPCIRWRQGKTRPSCLSRRRRSRRG